MAAGGLFTYIGVRFFDLPCVTLRSGIFKGKDAENLSLFTVALGLSLAVFCYVLLFCVPWIIRRFRYKE
jgi:hypothetical protein